MAINYLEPIAPLKKVDEATGDINYIYPITTANQVLFDDGERLNTILTENLLYLDDGEFESVSDPINANTLNGKTESELNVANADDADSLGGQPPEYYVSQRQFENGLDMALVDYVPKTKVPFSFGIDANGNYGYIKAGADTVTPFKSFDFKVKAYLTTSQYSGTTLTVNNCQIGKQYIRIISSWSSSGASSAASYCKFTSVTGCTYTKLIERQDGNQGCYSVFILNCTATTMKLTPGDAIILVLE